MDQLQDSSPEPGLSGWISYLAAHGSSMDPQKRRRVYLLTFAAAASLIWLPALLFVGLSPTTYTSRFSVIMPVTGAGQSLNLESIGQATATSSSPFAQHAVDPKVNYKAIAMSKPVLKAAAAKLDMHVSDLGEPRIKLVDQTALMNFSIKAETPELAQDKSTAIYEALQERLEQLRNDEVAERERYTNAALQAFSDKLAEAQQRIVQFQLKAGIISLEQFENITLGIEDSRRKLAAMRGRLAGLDARILAVRQSLGMDDETIHGVLALQQDATFQELLSRRAEAAVTLSEALARFGAMNFKVRDAGQVFRGLTDDLHERSAELGIRLRGTTAILEALSRNLEDNDNVEVLANLTAESSGLRAEVNALSRQIVTDQQRLTEGIADATTLEDLERKQQVALAVFTTALAKVDLGRSDNFASYPMLQLLAAPTLPWKADTLGKTLAIVGAVIGSLFCASGLLVLWFRKPFLQKILKSE